MKVTEVLFLLSSSLFLRLWHSLGEGGQRITFGWIRVTTLEGSQSFESLFGFQEGGDRSEKIFTPHTYQRSIWRILWKPGVCVPWVYEAAALGCAWEGVRSRQALRTGGWQSPKGGASKTLILNSSFCLITVCVLQNMDTVPLPTRHSGGQEVPDAGLITPGSQSLAVF